MLICSGQLNESLCFCSPAVSSVCRQKRRLCTTTAGQDCRHPAALTPTSVLTALMSTVQGVCFFFPFKCAACCGNVDLLWFWFSAGQRSMRSTKEKKKSWRPWISVSRNYRRTSWQPIRFDVAKKSHQSITMYIPPAPLWFFPQSG